MVVNLKANVGKYKDSVELLKSTDFFYYINGRFLPEKELLNTPD